MQLRRRVAEMNPVNKSLQESYFSHSRKARSGYEPESHARDRGCHSRRLWYLLGRCGPSCGRQGLESRILHNPIGLASPRIAILQTLSS
jgi:hypothetical protein